MNYAPHLPGGAVRRRAVIAAGTAGLVFTGFFIAGSTAGSPATQLKAAPRAGNPARTGRAAKQARTAAAVTGSRLLGEAAIAVRSVPYRAVQVVSWLAPGSSAAWLSSGPQQVRMDVSHRTGQPPNVVLGLSPTLVGLLDTHYVVVYTGQSSAAGRPASVVEVCRRDGSVAARFWLDDATKLPLRREIFDSHAHLISVDGLDGLKLATGAANPPGHSSTGTSNGTSAGGSANTGTRPATDPAPKPANPAAQQANNVSAEMSMAGFAGEHLALAPTAVAPVRPWSDRLGPAQLSVLRTRGWPVPAAMPGDLTLFGASESATSSGRVVDLAYSDGLSVISLFLQRGQLPATLPGWRQTELGGHQVYLRDPAEPDLAWSAGGYVYTVVAGAPAAVIASVVNSLPHQGGPGFWSRMNRGMRRVLSWMNPFR